MQLSQRLLIPLSSLLLAAVAFCADSKDTNKPAPKVAEQKLMAVVVWATDDEKPPDKEEELHPVEPDLKESQIPEVEELLSSWRQKTCQD